MRVHLTYDLEVWCFGWDRLDENFPAAFRRYIYGPPPKEFGALPLNLKILQDNGLKAVFFVEPLFSLRFGPEPLQEIVQLLLDHGQEVQLHLHPEWLDELAEPLVPRRKKTPNMHMFSREEQGILLSTGARLLQEAGAPRPTAFRAGNFSMNRDTLRALADQGFSVDSSLNTIFDFPYPAGEMSRRFHCSRIEQIAEFPVTLFRDGFGRPRPLQITACSAAEMEQALGSARDQGLPAATLVSHNFELLTPGLRKDDRIATRRFERLCAWLDRHRDEFPVGSYDPGLARDEAPEWHWPEVNSVATATRHAEQLMRRLQA